jgi:hypothetical protein
MATEVSVRTIVRLNCTSMKIARFNPSHSVDSRQFFIERKWRSIDEYITRAHLLL